MPENNPAPVPTAPAVHHSVQDKLITKYVTDAETFLITASTDPEIQPILAQHGYDAAAFIQRIKGFLEYPATMFMDLP